jgi:hypothetical protein
MQVSMLILASTRRTIERRQQSLRACLRNGLQGDRWSATILGRSMGDSHRNDYRWEVATLHGRLPKDVGLSSSSSAEARGVEGHRWRQEGSDYRGTVPGRANSNRLRVFHSARLEVETWLTCSFDTRSRLWQMEVSVRFAPTSSCSGRVEGSPSMAQHRRPK